MEGKTFYVAGLDFFPFLTLHSGRIQRELGTLAELGSWLTMSIGATEDSDDHQLGRREVPEHLRQVPKRTRFREDVDGA